MAVQLNRWVRGPANAIILGPNLTKARLNIPRDLVELWVKDVPRKCRFTRQSDPDLGRRGFVATLQCAGAWD